ncbi:hypothetical protein [Micromonospora olivasterospora]|uniref:Uncharacterized protein n=1 Tax=Micromonospora olivasterospora TaxID=1880 RepID=A0A562I738_MICOL|nr:hypothetical protein [Micromonospora olivasterospora]TWH66588.1 hypothetical protein JD77_01542 [Micromonospora olivasterospora]
MAQIPQATVATFQPSGGRSSTARAAPAPSTAPRIAQMATAQTGSTLFSSAARAGCMHSGATTVAPSAEAPAVPSRPAVVPMAPRARASRSVTMAPTTAALAANQPTQTSWAGQRLTVASVKAPVSWTMPNPYATPSWPAPASTLTPSAVSSHLPHVR